MTKEQEKGEAAMSQRKFLDRTREIDRLELIATRICKNALENITKTGTGHPGGSLSIADILTALYFGKTMILLPVFGKIL